MLCNVGFENQGRVMDRMSSLQAGARCAAWLAMCSSLTGCLSFGPKTGEVVPLPLPAISKETPVAVPPIERVPPVTHHETATRLAPPRAGVLQALPLRHVGRKPLRHVGRKPLAKLVATEPAATAQTTLTTEPAAVAAPTRQENAAAGPAAPASSGAQATAKASVDSQVRALPPVAETAKPAPRTNPIRAGADATSLRDTNPLR